MAISNTNLVPLLAFITFFLMLLNRVNSADSVSFTFINFDSDQRDLILQGDATIHSTSRTLRLIREDNSGNPMPVSVGRALYSAPIRLWKKGPVVASFNTTFTFVISRARNANSPADGLAFFIAPPDSTIAPGSNGARLGIYGPIRSNALNNSSLNQTDNDFKALSGRVVAVEFDTFPNTDSGDPSFRHIGINGNSMRSFVTRRWEWRNGAIATAHISYNSLSRRVTAMTTYPNGQSVSVSYDIALNTTLPEWVRVGFSGSTGAITQTNNILSWSFTSSLRTISLAKNEDMHIASVV